MEYTTKKFRGLVRSFGFFFHTTEHNHVPDTGRVEAKETIEKLKVTTNNTLLTTHCVEGTIISEVHFTTYFYNHSFIKQ